jgi:hypothetical protein
VAERTETSAQAWRRASGSPLVRAVCVCLATLAYILLGTPALAAATSGAQRVTARHHHHHASKRHAHRQRRRSVRRNSRTRRASKSKAKAKIAAVPATPVVFGIYPGGAAGTVGPSGTLKPEDPAKRLAALEQLRAPGRPFVLHLYAGYTGAGSYSAQQQVGTDISAYTAAGFQIELVLTYRPADGGSPQDVQGFASFTQAALAAFGPNPNFVSLQVTNEANVSNAPNASDGFYKGAEDALIAGVTAAHTAITQNGWGQVKVGFNWASAGNVNESSFWSYLGHHGGPAFVAALDWVGVDSYPGTWGPAIKGSLAQGTTSTLNNAFAALRNQYLPLAGIPFRVSLHVSENGYPTGPGRTAAMQVQALEAAVATVAAGQAKFNITGYRFFDLRDADSASTSFEDQYGLMTDTYAPKPAFGVYKQLVASFGQPQAARASALRRLQHALRLS